MAQVVERPLWEREVPGSSPGAPICDIMNKSKSFRQNAFLFLHTPADIVEEKFFDDVKTELSAVCPSPFPFSSLVLSANFRSKADGWLSMELQVCCDGEWSEFYKIAFLSGKEKRSFPLQQDSFGRVEVDELLLSRPAQAYRYRLKFFGDAELFSLVACGARDPFLYDEKTAAHLPSVPFEKELSPISQMEQHTPDCRRICSPVSVCMALNALGFRATVEEVLAETLDHEARIYGNWTFNVAAAGKWGAESFVRRFSSLEELAEFVTPESLVIASISYDEGDLSGAPLAHTSGHLVVIRGWGKGKILTADPAAPSADSVFRSYDARQFARAWLGYKRGLAYIVRKK